MNETEQKFAKLRGLLDQLEADLHEMKTILGGGKHE